MAFLPRGALSFLVYIATPVGFWPKLFWGISIFIQYFESLLEGRAMCIVELLFDSLVSEEEFEKLFFSNNMENGFYLNLHFGK